MLWKICRTKGHKWRTHRWGWELAYWDCKRIGCRAKVKAPWYERYLAQHTWTHPYTVEAPSPTE